MELKKYIMASDGIIYLTKSIENKIMTCKDSFGFWKLYRGKISFVFIIKTGDDYFEMRKRR